MPEDKVRHRLEFELYFHLGENRTCAKLARLQMPRLYPETPTDSAEYQTRFNSLYVKYKRWEKQENWGEKAEKRGLDNKRSAEKLVKKEEESLSETVSMYRRMIRYLLQKYAEQVAEGAIKLKSPDEAKRMMELDMYLTRVLESRPKLLASQILDLMSEDEKRQADRVFEWLRRETLKDSFVRDLQDRVQQEASVEVIDVLPLPKEAEEDNEKDKEEEKPKKKKEREAGVPDFLQPLRVRNPDE